ncbi:hypothetical protein [Sphingomonas sp. BK235]|uniref:hypothetical protein n=1 Tax=Sphingomonas sp. BK235 TaxID=2512131 RepID=UPI001050B60F|nr:hypothetical protein [Sphingomonas sp. BK235]TCP31353.1 hypothetical protein EV292_1108 [Sphingomonas sp. BK235]
MTRRRPHDDQGFNPALRTQNFGLSITRLPLVSDDTGYDPIEWMHPDSRMARSISEFSALLTPIINNADISPAERRALRIGLSLGTDRRLPETPSLANLKIRKRAYEILFEAVKPLWRPPGTRRRWFFVTLISDVGNSLEYQTVIELARCRRDYAKVLGRTGLQAVGLLELQAVSNYPGGGHGRMLELHAHAIGYTDDPRFKPQATARLLRDRTILTSWLGAPTVTIKPVNSLARLRGQCAYLFKAPVKCGRLMKDGFEPSGYKRFRGSINRPSLALRLAEVLCDIEFSRAVFCTGLGGKALKRDLLQRLRAWQARSPNAPDANLRRIIQKIWAGGRTSSLRHPVDVRRGVAAAMDPRWAHAISESRVKLVDQG